MRDEDWFWIVGLLIVGFVLWRKLAVGSVKGQETSREPDIIIPPIPEPKYERGELIGARKRPPAVATADPVGTSKAATQLAEMASVRKPATPPPNSTRPADPPRQRKPWLRGKARLEYQRKKSELLEREREEEHAARRELARQRAEERKQREEIEKARSMTAAEARMAEAAAKAATKAGRSVVAKERERLRQAYVSQKIPAHIHRDMKRFLAGEFDGAEQSPLTYVGYHVGIAAGLREHDRRERLEVCFRVPIPDILYADYKSWGEPASSQRLNSMMAHIRLQASLRATQSKYERAVSEWEADRAWLNSALSEKAEKLTLRWDGSE